MSEILLVVGFVVVVIGVVRGPTGGAGGAVLGAGVLAITLGAGEICWREHFHGFRSHVLFLALLPVVALHTVLQVAVGEQWAGPVPILVDLMLFVTLAFRLRQTYRRANGRAGGGASTNQRPRPRG